jgi:hypothetical protein
MQAERVTPVIPVDDLESAVPVWTQLLGTDPTFVDGDRWAQFDVGSSRVVLAGTGRPSDEAGVMIKVANLEIQTGPHELRALVTGAGAPVTIYSSL